MELVSGHLVLCRLGQAGRSGRRGQIRVAQVRGFRVKGAYVRRIESGELENPFRGPKTSLEMELGTWKFSTVKVGARDLD